MMDHFRALFVQDKEFIELHRRGVTVLVCWNGEPGEAGKKLQYAEFQNVDLLIIVVLKPEMM